MVSNGALTMNKSLQLFDSMATVSTTGIWSTNASLQPHSGMAPGAIPESSVEMTYALGSDIMYATLDRIEKSAILCSTLNTSCFENMPAELSIRPYEGLVSSAHTICIVHMMKRYLLRQPDVSTLPSWQWMYFTPVKPVNATVSAIRLAASRNIMRKQEYIHMARSLRLYHLNNSLQQYMSYPGTSLQVAKNCHLISWAENGKESDHLISQCGGGVADSTIFDIKDAVSQKPNKIHEAPPPKKKWTAEELRSFDCNAPVISTKTYRIAAYINAQDKHLFPDIPAIPIPLSVLQSRATKSMLLNIGQKHGAISRRTDLTVAGIADKLAAHVCTDCPQFLTIFEPNRDAFTAAERSKIYRQNHTESIKEKEQLRYQTRDEEYHNQVLAQKAEKYKAAAFPPKPCDKKAVSSIINGFVAQTSFSNLEEHGCAVCGALTPIAGLISLDTIDKKLLNCLIKPDVTRKERTWKREEIEEISGPVLASSCKHICIKCHNTVKKGKVPTLALANGLWLGDVPPQLQNLSWTEQLLISKVIRNRCVIRVSKSKMHKMRANAICHAVPMPKIYSTLPPKRSELDEVLAFLYVGPTMPTPNDFKRTPLLIRRNRVIDALEWLKLNHTDYANIEISKENMSEYSEDESPVVIEYQEVEDVSIPEAQAVNDTGDYEGTIEGPCPFTVHTLTSDKLTDLIDQDQRSLLRIKALQHFKQGGKAMGITHAQEAESIYDNPQLYPQMFPWLFPYGYGGIGNTRQQNKVSDMLHKRHLLMYHDKRFQKDPYFPLIAFNQEQIKSSVTGGFLLASRENFSTIAQRLLHVKESVLSALVAKFEKGPVTAEDLSEQEKECYKVLNDIDYIGAHVPGSVTNRKHLRNEIWSLSAYLGAPSWFITYAPADIEHPIAIYLAGSDTAIYPTNLSKDERFWMIANNPVAGARFFKIMTEAFIKHVLGYGSTYSGLYGKTAGYYGTVEQQGRLTLHMHMLIWIKHSLSPQEIRDKIMDPESDFQKKIVEYLEATHIGEFMDKTLAEVEHDICTEEVEKPQRQSPVNTEPVAAPAHTCNCLIEHICDACIKYTDWWSYFKQTVNELLYCSNRHRCQNGSCKNNKYGTCKARFPRKVQLETQVDPSTGALIMKKGEAWLNTFSPVLTYLLRCNTDVTCLLSGTAIKSVIAYVTDYITKTPLKTHTMFETVKTIFKRETEMLAGEESKKIKARKVLVKIVNSLTSQSEIGGPMACMYLLGHPDHYTSHTFQRFYWRAYVNEVRKAWEVHNPIDDGIVNKAPPEKLVLTKSEDKVVGIDTTTDYIFRPSKYEAVSLYDWVRRARKARMSKKRAEG